MRRLFYLTFFISILVILLLAYNLPFDCNLPNTVEQYDAIVILGNPATSNCEPGKIMQERIDHGFDLYQNGYSTRLILSGGSVANECIESKVMRKNLILKGVDSERILIDSLSTNTYQNAYFVNKLGKKMGYNNLLIVTSNFHRKRTCGIFSRYDLLDFTITCPQYSHEIKWNKNLILKIRESLILTYHLIFGYKTDLGLNF